MHNIFAFCSACSLPYMHTHIRLHAYVRFCFSFPRVPPQSGDAMRAVDTMGVIRSETFLLVDGPALVSNATLGAAIAAHNARNRADNNAIMTLVMQRRSSAPASAAAVYGGAATLTKVVLSAVDGKIHGYVRACGRACVHFFLR